MRRVSTIGVFLLLWLPLHAQILPGILNVQPAAGGGGGIAFVSGNAAWASGTAATTTTAAINTTGATLLLVACANLNSSNTFTSVSDSKSNSGWTAGTSSTLGAADGSVQVWYINANLAGGTLVVGSGHTFTCHQSASAFMATGAMSFSGTLTVSTPYDSAAHTISSTTTSLTLATGSVTPTQTGELLITGLAGNAGTSGTTVTIGNGFTNVLPIVSTWNLGFAYLIDGNTSPINPTWTVQTTADILASTIQGFLHP